jgi:hypothetical protein
VGRVEGRQRREEGERHMRTDPSEAGSLACSSAAWLLASLNTVLPLFHLSTLARVCTIASIQNNLPKPYISVFFGGRRPSLLTYPKGESSLSLLSTFCYRSTSPVHG